MTSLWPRLERLLSQAERPARYINSEWGATYKPNAQYRFCMIYPDTYELGQANQALRILCNVVNKVEGMAAERAFLPAPEFADLMRKEDLPLFSLESCMPLKEFDCLGITLPHELAATNVLEALDLAGIPLCAEDRGEEDPLIFAGGPCAFNPEPYYLFFDAFLLGEGEESVPEMLKLHRELKAQGLTREEILLEIARTHGAYVPRFYDWRSEEEAQAEKCWIVPKVEGLPTRFEKRLFDGFDMSPAWEPCIVPFTEVIHDRLNVEILRGCTRGCRFCQAGMMYRPVRERSADNIVEAVLKGLEETGYDEVSLTSLSTTDHSQIAEILERLNKACEGKGIRISIPSQRLDSFGVEMAELVAGQKKGGLTFAPEAGTQRMRDVINKNVTEDDLFNAIDAAFSNGWTRCKLYFMIGLPTETDDDVKGIARLVQQAYDRACKAVGPERKGRVKVSASVALFVPKAQTPFQWDGQISKQEAWRRVDLLRKSVKYRAVDVHWHDPSTSFIEALMSRGDRRSAHLILEAFKRGARFDAWSEGFDEKAWRDAAAHLGIDLEEIAEKNFDTSYVLPWDHCTTGVSTRYLAHERKLADLEKTTPDCSYEHCTACGVCPDYKCHIVCQEERH